MKTFKEDVKRALKQKGVTQHLYLEAEEVRVEIVLKVTHKGVQVDSLKIETQLFATDTLIEGKTQALFWICEIVQNYIDLKNAITK